MSKHKKGNFTRINPPYVNSSKIHDRDGDLDLIRMFAMLWVILVHCIFWMGLWDSGTALTLRSFILFEMPLFFFVTGAVLYKSKTNFKKFYLRRFQRILIPYWVYAILCVLLNIILVVFLQGDYLDVGALIFSWILPIDQYISYVPYLTGALWFIPIYLLVILFFPLLKYMRGKIESTFPRNGWVSWLPLIVPVLIIMLLDVTNANFAGISYFRETVFYLFWVYLGTFYDSIKDLSRRRVVFALIIVAMSALLICLFGQLGLYSYYMQNNKFPPNIMFVLFSICAMVMLYLLKDILLKGFKILLQTPLKIVLNEFKNHCYSVYLYQTFAFCALYLIMHIFILPICNITSPYLLLIVYLVITIPLCAFFGKVFGIIEKIQFINR